MARGIFQAQGSVASNADTTIGAAPGVGERIHVFYVTITVTTAGTTSRAVVTDGVSGLPLGRLNTSTADAMLNINYATGFRVFPGRPLTENTALVLTTSGAAAATVTYDAAWEVK